jgi:2-phospho-L-lactate guanylyltransferase
VNAASSRSGWGAVVAAKELAAAKTRLRNLGQAATVDIVIAMFEDTLAALSESSRTEVLVVVTSDVTLADIAVGWGAWVVADPGRGLNEAFLAGADRLAAGVSGVALLPADLPCLRSEHIDACLGEAGEHQAAVVPDAEGRGSTLLAHRVGWQSGPRFGSDSLAHHVNRGALPLWDTPMAARRDVDAPADLLDALRLGVGKHTGTICDDLGLRASAPAAV